MKKSNELIDGIEESTWREIEMIAKTYPKPIRYVDGLNSKIAVLKKCMALFKDLKDLKEELQYWQNYEPVNNMGKWYVSVRISKLKSKIERIEKELEKRKKRLDS